MTDVAAVEATVHGRVQGVFFRDFVSRRARQLGLTGFVRNLPGGSVEVIAEGKKEHLEELIGYLKVGPPAARVKEMITSWSEYTGNHSSFKVRH